MQDFEESYAAFAKNVEELLLTIPDQEARKHVRHPPLAPCTDVLQLIWKLVTDKGSPKQVPLNSIMDWDNTTRTHHGVWLQGSGRPAIERDKLGATRTRRDVSWC